MFGSRPLLIHWFCYSVWQDIHDHFVILHGLFLSLAHQCLSFSSLPLHQVTLVTFPLLPLPLFFVSPKPPSLFPLQTLAANDREGDQCSLATANPFGRTSTGPSYVFGGWRVDPDQGKVTWQTQTHQLSVNTHGTDSPLPH